MSQPHVETHRSPLARPQQAVQEITPEPIPWLPSELSRRAWLRGAAVGSMGVALAQCCLRGELEAAQETLAARNRFPRMVQEFFVEQVRKAEAEANRRRNALKTKEDAERYVKEVQAKALQSFGPFPEKTPLEVRTTSTVKRDTYRIENIIYESRPGFLVTANLYVPTNRKFPLPGVVGVCGHSTNGKAGEAYQAFAQGLARQGYVVLILDPVSQGERLQHLDKALKPIVGAGVSEHLLCGNQQFLVGEFLGTWRCWDAMRGLDYLLSREEVDPKHIGITGNSGGGTITTWLCGVEQRWTMAAPSCFVTTFRRNLENELSADTEQCPPGVIALGLDHADFLAAMAPKPVIVLAKEKDFFDVRGSEEAYERLRKLYKLLGAEDHVALFTGPTPHGYSQENREAMYRWFNRFTGISDATTEPELTIEKDEVLYAAPKGQVATLDSKTIMAFTREKSKALAKQRGEVSGAKLLETLPSVLKLPPRKGTPDYRILRAFGGRRWPRRSATPYAVETEPGIHAIVYRLDNTSLVSRPPLAKDLDNADKGVLLYVSHHSADAELRDDPWVRELIEAHGGEVFTCDVRGVGESKPDTGSANSFLTPYGNDYLYAIHSIMLDRPYVGQKTHDVLSVLDWIRSFGHKKVHLAAKGWGALPATFAALLHPTVRQVSLKNALTSYSEVAESDLYGWPLSCLLPNALAHFDLPDCYRALRDKQLTVVEPWGANPPGTRYADHDHDH